MKVISPLLKHVVYPGLSRSGYLRRNANAGVAVVTYHGILPQGYAARDPVLDGNLISRDAFVRQARLHQIELQRYFSRAVFALVRERRDVAAESRSAHLR
jgi:hypothetical protein